MLNFYQINVKESYFICIALLIYRQWFTRQLLFLLKVVKYKGHFVDRFSSELLDMSLQPLTFNWCFFFPRGLREKKLYSDCSVFSFNRFSYVGYIILFEEKWLSSQLVLPQVQKVRLLLRDRSCVASFLPQSEIKNV